MDAADTRTASSSAASTDAGSWAYASGNAALWRGVDQAHIMGLELIVAVALWGGIGWWIDGRLGTGAWFTVIGALIGNAAGVYLVWLRAQRIDGLDAASQERAAASEDAATGGPAGVR